MSRSYTRACERVNCSHGALSPCQGAVPRPDKAGLQSADAAARRPYLIEQALFHSRIRIDATVAEEWPMCAMFVHLIPFHIGHDNLFAIG
jgi:hypothetical protein